MLALIPARGGSKGVPRKNLRTVNGRPLVAHTIDLLRTIPDLDIVVSTDSREIAAVAGAHGAKVLGRPERLADDTSTVYDVAVHAANELGTVGEEIGIFQPTSPCLTGETVHQALLEFYRGNWDSLASVVEEPHLFWDDDGPLYYERKNRQTAASLFRETGGIQLSRRFPPLIGVRHKLFTVAQSEGLDVDTFEDLEAARRTQMRRRIRFEVTAGPRTGSGHVRRTIVLADELAHHDISFVFRGEHAGWASRLVEDAGYKVGVGDPEWIGDPHLVVMDCLDNSVEHVAQVKALGAKVVCLEDLGGGGADLTINELYGQQVDHVSQGCAVTLFNGPRYSVLRPEFSGLPEYRIPSDPRVLITFGGTDPAGLGSRVRKLVGEHWNPSLVLGPDASVSMMEEMRRSTLVVTSAGRTVHECAAVGVPCISIAANEREARHSHCAGVLRLGLHAALSDEQIRETIERVMASTTLREEMSVTSRGQIDGLGARRIVRKVEDLLEGL